MRKVYGGLWVDNREMLLNDHPDFDIIKGVIQSEEYFGHKLVTPIELAYYRRLPSGKLSDHIMDTVTITKVVNDKLWGIFND